MSSESQNPTTEKEEMVVETEAPAYSAAAQPTGSPDRERNGQATGNTMGQTGTSGTNLRRPDPLGSPIVAVCGLAGGVGTTALTMMLGFAAAAQDREAVLVADTGGSGANLAAFANQRSDHSLTSAANANRLGVLDGSTMFTELSPRLRLIGREPDLAGDNLADLGPELADLLTDAQEAHLAVFVDCGRLESEAQVEVARNATHIIWITTGDATGARKARASVESTSLAGAQSDFLLVRAARGKGLTLKAEREIRRAAEEADAMLVFCPDAGDIVEQGIEATATRIAHELRVTLARIL